MVKYYRKLICVDCFLSDRFVKENEISVHSPLLKALRVYLE